MTTMTAATTTDPRSTMTTGQIAKVCGVSVSTVGKWVDSGELKGRRLPGSYYRRVERDDLIRFLACNGMSIKGISRPAVLLVGLSSTDLARIIAGLPEGWAFVTATSTFVAGVMAAEFPPGLVVLDPSLGRIVADRLVQSIRSRPDGPAVRVLWIDRMANRESQCSGPDGCEAATIERVIEIVKGGGR